MRKTRLDFTAFFDGAPVSTVIGFQTEWTGNPADGFTLVQAIADVSVVTLHNTHISITGIANRYHDVTDAVRHMIDHCGLMDRSVIYTLPNGAETQGRLRFALQRVYEYMQAVEDDIHNQHRTEPKE